MVHVKTSLPAKEAFAFPLPPLRSTANKMGRRHRRQRTPKYHCLSALGHEETFTKIPLFELNVAVRRFHCAFRSGYGRTQRLNGSIKVLRRIGFPSSYCFPQFANASSVVDLGSSLTIKARTVTIFSGHTILSGKHAIPLSSEHADPTCTRILLGSIRPPRGRQSRNESQESDTITIALTPPNSNTIYERWCSLHCRIPTLLSILFP